MFAQLVPFCFLMNPVGPTVITVNAVFYKHDLGKFE
jgi:hypothetical protein